MSVAECINSNISVRGQELIDWINADKSTKNPQEQVISSKLYHKYIVDREGKPRNKIYPDVYYYVNHNNHFNKDIYLAYIVRDKSKSPRKIPESLAKLDIISSEESFKGSLIQEWAYYQNGSAANEFYMEGNEIVTKYFESSHPLRLTAYYFVSNTSKGIKVFRDTSKSPRPNSVSEVSQATYTDIEPKAVEPYEGLSDSGVAFE